LLLYRNTAAEHVAAHAEKRHKELTLSKIFAIVAHEISRLSTTL